MSDFQRGTVYLFSKGIFFYCHTQKICRKTSGIGRWFFVAKFLSMTKEKHSENKQPEPAYPQVFSSKRAGLDTVQDFLSKYGIELRNQHALLIKAI